MYLRQWKSNERVHEKDRRLTRDDELVASNRVTATIAGLFRLCSDVRLSVARGKEVHLSGLSFTETICGLPQGRGNYGRALNY